MKGAAVVGLGVGPGLGSLGKNVGVAVGKGVGCEVGAVVGKGVGCAVGLPVSVGGRMAQITTRPAFHAAPGDVLGSK